MVAIRWSVLAVPASAQWHATGGLPYPFGTYSTGSLPYDILKTLRSAQGDTGGFDCKPHVPGSSTKEDVDWASILSTPRDQGFCGSCYTFASIAVMEGAAYIDLSKTVELSEMQLVDCAATDVDALFPGQQFPRPANDTHPDYHVVGGCAGGWPSVALKHFTQSGVDSNPAKCVCSRSSYEYEGDLKPRCDQPGLDPSVTPCYHENGEEYREPVLECRESSCECALPAAVVEDCYEVGVDGQLSAVDALKEALSQRPIAVNILSSPLFDRKFAEPGYAGVVPADDVKCQPGDKTDHAVVAVGFGKDEQGREYWKIRNSWGADWGEGGYVRVEIVDDQAGSLCMNTNVWVYPKLTSAPDSGEPTTVAPLDPTTQEPPTVAPVEPETEEPPTVAPVDPTIPTTQEPTIAPTTQAPDVPTTEQPTIAPVDPARCKTCLTFCAPCEACAAGPEGSFAFGSCEKCWKCWDWDDDELEDDDDDMDKDCDAMHKKHDWDDEEVRCLNNDHEDCRACWTELGEMSVFV